MSEGRALINFIGNAVATVVIATHEKELDTKRFELVVGKWQDPDAVEI